MIVKLAANAISKRIENGILSSSGIASAFQHGVLRSDSRMALGMERGNDVIAHKIGVRFSEKITPKEFESLVDPAKKNAKENLSYMLNKRFNGEGLDYAGFTVPTHSLAGVNPEHKTGIDSIIFSQNTDKLKRTFHNEIDPSAKVSDLDRALIRRHELFESQSKNTLSHPITQSSFATAVGKGRNTRLLSGGSHKNPGIVARESDMISALRGRDAYDNTLRMRHSTGEDLHFQLASGHAYGSRIPPHTIKGLSGRPVKTKRVSEGDWSELVLSRKKQLDASFDSSSITKELTSQNVPSLHQIRQQKKMIW